MLETGRIARQADGAVFASWGETTVLATVVAAKSAKPGQDFFPLTVHYQEKAFAAGRIPGGFLKREGRLSDKETLTSRLIDRPIRPLFPDDFRCETQIIVTVLSHDMETDPDILAMIAASAALTLSGVPFMGPIGGARVGYIKDEIVVNPTLEQLKDSVLDLVVAGTADAVLMVESEAKELSEDTMLQAVMAGHASFQPVIRGDHPARGKGRQGAARTRDDRQVGGRESRARCRRGGFARCLFDHAQAGPLCRRRCGEGEGGSRAAARGRSGGIHQGGGRRSLPRARRPRSSAGTFSIMAAGSTAAT